MLLIVGIFAFPVSPKWLLKHGKKDDAIQIMARPYDTAPEDERVQTDVKGLVELNAVESGSKLTWREFLSNGKDMNLWRASAACGSQAFQQIGEHRLGTLA